MAGEVSQLIDDLAALSRPAKNIGRTLNTVPAAAPIPAKSGIGKPATGGTGSIASPLTETAYADRQFHTNKTMTSSDGVFTLVWKPIKQMKFTDANNAEEIRNFADIP